MAQIIELVGDFEGEVKWGGRYSREIFDSSGELVSFPFDSFVWGGGERMGFVCIKGFAGVGAL